MISRFDSALDYNEEDYEKYLDDLDVSHLSIDLPQATVFVMRRILSYKVSTTIKNEQIKMRGKGEMDVRLGTTMMEEVRASLIDIKHPQGVDPGKLAYKKESDGLASMELLALLETYGIVADLYKARKSILDRKSNNISKKKSVQSLNSHTQAVNKEKTVISPATAAH